MSSKFFVILWFLWFINNDQRLPTQWRTVIRICDKAVAPLYALPVGYGQSRILIRRYGNFYKPSFTLKPRWLEHLRQNKILEEDLAFIVAQDRFFQDTSKSIQGNYFPLKTCDTFVMEHRRWLDNFGKDLPWYVGLTTSKLPNEKILKQFSSQLDTRFKRHTQHCNSCRGTYQWLNKIQLVGQVIAVLTLCLTVTTDDSLETVSSIVFVLAVIAIVVSKTFKTKLAV